MFTSGIILGVGAPNLCRDGRKTKCAILLSQTLGLIRVYPIPAEIQFPVWGIVDCEVTPNPSDTRRESYKIAPGFEVRDKELYKSVDKRALLDDCSLKSGAVDPIDYQNEKRASIAIVKETADELLGAMSRRTPEVHPDDGEFGWITVKDDHPYKPYIDWKSMQGKHHRSHLVGHEVYEGLRKHRDNPHTIFDIMQTLNPNFDRWLLLGNMRDRRNVWCVVHLHRLKQQDALGIQSLFDDEDRPDGWPYFQQETTNEPVMHDQLALFGE